MLLSLSQKESLLVIVLWQSECMTWLLWLSSTSSSSGGPMQCRKQAQLLKKTTLLLIVAVASVGDLTMVFYAFHSLFLSRRTRGKPDNTLWIIKLFSTTFAMAWLRVTFQKYALPTLGASIVVYLCLMSCGRGGKKLSLRFISSSRSWFLFCASSKCHTVIRARRFM